MSTSEGGTGPNLYAPWPGHDDLRQEADGLASRLPGELAPLARIAYTYRWAWLEGGPDLFRSVDEHRWALCGGNPVRLLQEARAESLARAANDEALLARAASVEAAIRADQRRPWLAEPVSRERPAVFVCAEYGIHPSLPVYAGGLGVLAGDLLKEASDQRVPLVAVGLLYRQGYFRQRLDRTGRQHEFWVETDPERLPAALVTDGDGTPVVVPVDVRRSVVHVQIWRVDVGRVALYLLDTERPENDRVARWITSQLYVGDPWIRLDQYALLGIGGLRALRALGIEPGLVHLNEGHAAFAPLELARQAVEDGADPHDALARARARTIFTTHTPVPAGNDTYPVEDACQVLAPLPDRIGVSTDEMCELGSTGPGEGRMGVTQLALRMSRAANGVSRRHGEVARMMWRAVFPDRPVEDVPIRHVTNGVHVGTWMADPMRGLLDRHLGAGWEEGAADPEVWAGVEGIDDADLWAVRGQLRRALVDYVRDRSTADRLMRGEAPEYVRAAGVAFDPEALTIGFARRLATYKRLHLLVADAGRALALLRGDHHVQLVMAGKAHPRDDEAKQVVERLFTLKGAPGVDVRVAYLHDYDLAMAPTLVAGCDVWLNLPRPPQEASGTSGMKSALNGGLQLSVLDGWWAEGYDGTNGWAIGGEVDPDVGGQDARHAAELYDIFERQVLPEFHDRDGAGVPTRWVRRMKASLRTIGPRFSAARMMADYLAGPYRG